MAKLISVVGNPGTGKSTSISFLNPDETAVINVSGKMLPFKGAKKKYISLKDNKEKFNYLETDNTESIAKVLNHINLKRPEIHQVIIDDAGYLISFESMGRSLETGWNKYTEISSHFFDVVKSAKDMREDLTVIFMFHDELEENGTTGITKRIIKVASKSIKKNLEPEGLFAIVLFTEVTQDPDGKTRYNFITNDGITCTAKTPMGLYDEKYIPNNLQLLMDRIKKYELED